MADAGVDWPVPLVLASTGSTNDDVEGLMTAALLLNQLWHQQAAIAAWLGREAALNLVQAWQTPS